MRVIDPGHKYELTEYDGGTTQTITFMKREGDGYPGNVGHYPGTNLQEVIRALIDRVQYLNTQIPHDENRVLVGKLRDCLLHLEWRAAGNHEYQLEPLQLWDHWDDDIPIETLRTCVTCGHIRCDGHGEKGTR